MIKLNTLLFFILFPLIASGECLPKNPESVVDPKTFEGIQKIMEKTNTTQKQKWAMLDENNSDNSKEFIKNLPEKERDKLNNFLKKIKWSKDPLITIVEGETDPILLVNGLDIMEFPHVWVKPFHKLQSLPRASYYFQWNKFDSMETNKQKLLKAIRTITAKHPDKKLTIIGYSAGGVVTTRAMDDLANDPVSKRIEFHTVASPIFGYNAPFMAYFGVPFAGKTSIEIGLGQYEKLKNKRFNNCHHWVNTACELDQHSCDYEKVNPELGPVGSKISLLPCGAENVTGYKDENHSSIVSRAFFDIIK